MGDNWLKEFETGKEAAREAAKFIKSELAEHAGQDNLFLISGGSSLDVAYWAASDLDVNSTNGVTLAQADERYGEVGHADSNWQAAIDKGIRPIMFRNTIETLKLGTSPSDMAVSYNRTLIERMDNLGYKIALLGVGSDGQIAGIKPDTEEGFDRFLGNDLVVEYKANDFTRITITARALLQMDMVVVYACGPDKKAALDRVYSADPLNEFPAQMLKRCRNVQVFFGQSC